MPEVPSGSCPTQDTPAVSRETAFEANTAEGPRVCRAGGGRGGRSGPCVHGPHRQTAPSPAGRGAAAGGLQGPLRGPTLAPAPPSPSASSLGTVWPGRPRGRAAWEGPGLWVPSVLGRRGHGAGGDRTARLLPREQTPRGRRSREREAVGEGAGREPLGGRTTEPGVGRHRASPGTLGRGRWEDTSRSAKRLMFPEKSLLAVASHALHAPHAPRAHPSRPQQHPQLQVALQAPSGFHRLAGGRRGWGGGGWGVRGREWRRAAGRRRVCHRTGDTRQGASVWGRDLPLSPCVQAPPLQASRRSGFLRLNGPLNGASHLHEGLNRRGGGAVHSGSPAQRPPPRRPRPGGHAPWCPAPGGHPEVRGLSPRARPRRRKMRLQRQKGRPGSAPSPAAPARTGWRGGRASWRRAACFLWSHSPWGQSSLSSPQPTWCVWCH